MIRYYQHFLPWAVQCSVVCELENWERRVYYLFSTFLCQGRLTFLGHNLSNPETMCHNVSVSQHQPGTKSAKYRQCICISMSAQFPASLLQTVSDPASIEAHDQAPGWQNSDVTGDLWEAEMRKLSRERERRLEWLIWLDTKVWAGTKWRELIRAEPGLRGGWPGNCLTRTRPRTTSPQGRNFQCKVTLVHKVGNRNTLL